MDLPSLLADLRRELAAGNISTATEAHIRNEFRAARVRSAHDAAAAVFDREATQLEREAAALRALRARHFGYDNSSNNPSISRALGTSDET